MSESTDPQPWYLDVVMPALLESARTTYGMAMRRALLDAGFDDVPARGIGLIGGIARNGPAAQQDLTEHLSITKQAASQLVDQLVLRGYLERSADPVDRRRMLLTLTPRGNDAAAESAKAVATIDAALDQRFSADEVATCRRMLGTLSAIGARARERKRAAAS
ncbi:MAG: hypothetical protein JWM34_712 [Ilumatobacteraceae bacterium]|nr:hypothetical protein [Ilumatobacteraceae bacterium]